MKKFRLKSYYEATTKNKPKCNCGVGRWCSECFLDKINVGKIYCGKSGDGSDMRLMNKPNY